MQLKVSHQGPPAKRHRADDGQTLNAGWVSF